MSKLPDPPTHLNPPSAATTNRPGAVWRREPRQALKHRHLLACAAVFAGLAWHAATTAAHAADTPAVPAAAASSIADDSPSAFVSFVLETTSNCMLNNGQQVQMRSTHPSRKIRVWLDRYQRGIGTGDRSRTDLAPGAEPDPLGCSRSAAGVQEWRVVKAQFVD